MRALPPIPITPALLTSTTCAEPSAGETVWSAATSYKGGDRVISTTTHRTYEALIEEAYALVCDAGGFALSPHTYGPRSLPIAKVDRDIVTALRLADAPDVRDTHPLRPEIDLITRTKEGELKAPARV